MFGFTSSGCFILGIILGFILAAIVGVFCIFYFNPDFKNKSIEQVEYFWQKIKDNVDDSIDSVKKAPVASSAPNTSQVSEPEISSDEKKEVTRYTTTDSGKNKTPGLIINIGQ